MKLLVLGGGQQGRVVASDLAQTFPQHRITVADLRDPRVAGFPNLSWIEADLADAGTLVRLMREHDLVVGALPSRLGYRAMRAAIEAGRNLVDVSMCAEDAMRLDADAKLGKVAIVPDCGCAPGLSNLIAGHAAATGGTPDEITILVGGVAAEPSHPFGYVVTWSLEDLQEEYLRPARIRTGGRGTTVPALSGLERVTIDGVGEMEAFYSDGLRTLLQTMPDVREMGEKTLRWPGHVEAVRPLVATNRMIDEFRERCADPEPHDLVVLLVRFRRGSKVERVWMVDRYDAANRMTAMARTTAFTCSAAVQLAAAGGIQGTGVLPLEVLGREEAAWRFLTGALLERGVRLQSAVG